MGSIVPRTGGYANCNQKSEAHVLIPALAEIEVMSRARISCISCISHGKEKRGRVTWSRCGPEVPWTLEQEQRFSCCLTGLSRRSVVAADITADRRICSAYVSAETHGQSRWRHASSRHEG